MTRESPFGTSRLPVAVLGATGAVGQTFVRLLANHPWFDLIEVGASERSAGKSYAEATKWLGDSPIPPAIASLTVQPCSPASIRAPVVFSAMDAAAAQDAEPGFAKSDRIVLTNARNYRMEPDVPLVIAEVNPDHLDVIVAQRKRRGWSGAIVANGNCAAIVGAMALAPIQQRFGIRRVFFVSMQAVSGAGYPGVASLDILGNVIPYIKDEEPKVEEELCKFLGLRESDHIQGAPMVVSAHTNRVPVEHGHTICMSVELNRKGDAVEVEAHLANWRGAPEAGRLPSSPERPLVLTKEADRPQPRRDVDAGGGMTVTVGRVRRDPILDVRLVAMGHNVIRGAAGASVLNAELMASTGRLPKP